MTIAMFHQTIFLLPVPLTPADTPFASYAGDLQDDESSYLFTTTDTTPEHAIFVGSGADVTGVRILDPNNLNGGLPIVLSQGDSPAGSNPPEIWNTPSVLPLGQYEIEITGTEADSNPVTITQPFFIVAPEPGEESIVLTSGGRLIQTNGDDLLFISGSV